ncbi:hypothetical protein A2926_03990 [Candidatus Giovannonibacteria bacterium RIFCSPLOWO2_01_FULL_44_40]|uniref:Uncharacterized protein n=1 Tax=Candidatus Giovannonibacteria bacterium RIFCSPHIGHO2_01_FULL_45_23 TaxID=1798325 RepID=A0A1F5VIY0_9BACT|nr:MAG: hypothetical protein A2834_04150 [Candidatus Giovannonibacteria bacterium RIFCSPHIGHO2_01_FULL_45_23]OGF75525.1 MAG: hypothetical protein A3C77_00665 [Candidatus Giovannonibacteria bacterium RIFCSPHIGHO2_02_FULL_45_13]OGF80152.1 MAG: hypothetical protein A2926_03990 [Candidatus Giovannonibacteria bacterium RIFCSPLOWO2_01_FULL_44_40]
MENKLKKRIMRRVYAIWFIRRGLPMVAGSVVSFYIAMTVTAERFFVAQIFSNLTVAAHSGFLGMSKFIISALNSVEPSVLVLISIAGIVSFALAVKLLRSIRSIVAGAGAAVAEARKF